MHERVIDETKKYIKEVLDQGLDQGDNLKYLGELIDIQKDVYKIICMKEGNDMYGNYGNYGNYGGRNPGYDNYGRGNYGEYGEGSYGEYNRGGNYGKRGVDSKYRGHDHLDRVYGEYGRYMEGKERYGASEETDKSFHYMIKALEDFINVLHEETETPQQKQMLNETLQRSMR